MSDLRLALRMLVRNPGFTLVVVLTLAIGIGATTAIFSVASGVMLRPLPFADPDSLAVAALLAAAGVVACVVPRSAQQNFHQCHRSKRTKEDTDAV